MIMSEGKSFFSLEERILPDQNLEMFDLYDNLEGKRFTVIHHN